MILRQLACHVGEAERASIRWITDKTAREQVQIKLLLNHVMVFIPWNNHIVMSWQRQNKYWRNLHSRLKFLI